MKILTLLLLIFSIPIGWVEAHDHIEIRISPSNPTKLSVFGNFTETATYFPLGEAPSSYLEFLPGGAFISELTFSAFETTNPPSGGATAVVEVLSITGPAGGSVSFWEQYLGIIPAFTKPTGWTASQGDTLHIIVSEDEDGYGHIHSRAFSMNLAGVYVVAFRVIDTQENFQSSDTFQVQFTAQAPPPLSIALASADAQLSLNSRADFTYDLQSSTSLDWDDWETIDTQDGDGSPLTFIDPRANRPKVFYRLVEY